MIFPEPLIAGTLVRRFRRSLADVRLTNGKVVTVFSPGLGPMTGCSEPGRPVLLSDSRDANRKNRLTWELINMHETWVSVNPAHARRVVQESLEQHSIPTLTDYELQTEAFPGFGRKTDFILQGMERNCFVTVFSVSWAEHDVAMFPDAPSPRFRERIDELADISRRLHHAVALFIVLRPDCSRFRLVHFLDQNFADACEAATQAGVELLVYRATVTPGEVALGSPIPFAQD